VTDRVTGDFIFGTLATDELRLDAMREAGRGVTHASDITPLDPRPGDPVTVRVSVGPGVNASRVVVPFTVDGSEPGPSSEIAELSRGRPQWDTLLWAYRDIWEGALPPQPNGTFVRYRVVAIETDGTEVWADPDPWTGRPETFGYHVDDFRLPPWARDAVIYHIFVDRFWPGNGNAWNDTDDLSGFWGGTIRGVIDKLPYLSELGVTCLWLSPVFASPSHHGYDATDYFTVEPRLGTEADLIALFDAAHASGMRVLLDFVANHVSNEHPVFQRAIMDPQSAERRWFTFRDWPHDYRSFFGVTSLPQIDTGESEARDYLFRAAGFWLERGADGFRLDYANGPTHAFWSEFRSRTREAAPECLTIGEVVETAEFQRSYHGRLDGTLDFLMLQHIRAFFAFDSISTAEFDAFVQRHLAYFPDSFILPSFLDNHDMNRFLWVAHGDVGRLKLAALWQFTLPYPPVIYYGTEAGLSQLRDVEHDDGSRTLEGSRMPMRWTGNLKSDLWHYYKDVIALRGEYRGIWRASRRTVTASEDGLYVVDIDSNPAARVLLNKSDAPREVDIPRDADVVVSSEVVDMGDASARLGPMAGAVMIWNS
jgi:cyclomaltodextrinase